MQIISIAPRLQTHRWSVYLNAPSFTCTTRIDALAVKVMECETVLGTIEKICIKLPGDFIKRRTKGFAEHLQQVMFMELNLIPLFSGMTLAYTSIALPSALF